MKHLRALLVLTIISQIVLWAHCNAGTTWTISYAPTNVDMGKVRATRLSRHNTERTGLWLSTYTGSAKLNATAQKRAEYLASINKATHVRNPSDGYYNYSSIKARFTGQKINFPKEKSGIPNFTENLAYQTYKCTKSDCTQDLIDALKKWFTFFMSEKKYKGPHYKAIINKQFKIVGMWVGVIGTRYYVVTHYVTQIMK